MRFVWKASTKANRTTCTKSEERSLWTRISKLFRISAPSFAVATTSGTLFGFWLALSDILSPARVQQFFDVFGDWDPTLVFVMLGAVSVSVIGHFFLKRHSRPLFGEKWHFPWEKKGTIDAKLIGGSVLFGIGWGLSGACPGPALGNIVFGNSFILVFLIAMLASMTLYKLTSK